MKEEKGMNEEKKPPSAEMSLKYMAWDMKNLVKELATLNKNLEELIKSKSKIEELF